jgi:hypothetical protein
MGGMREDKLLVVMVRTRRGILSCLVKRIEAEDPVRAERRARESRPSGTCKLMAFRAEADWIVYNSKMVSYDYAKLQLRRSGARRNGSGLLIVLYAANISS